MKTNGKLLAALLLMLVMLTVVACQGTDDEVKVGDFPATESLIVAPADVAILEVSSPNFQEKKRPRKRIPKENTCYGENISPPLNWNGVPTDTRSLAVIMEEPHEARAKEAYYTIVPSFGSIHWVVYNIPPEITGLLGGVSTSTSVLSDGTTQGINEFGGLGYSGPCPPPSLVRKYTQPGRTSDAPHDYYFRVYALDVMLDLAPVSTKADLIEAMEGHILGYGEVFGKFQGPRQQGWFTAGSGSPVANTPTPAP